MNLLHHLQLERWPRLNCDVCTEIKVYTRNKQNILAMARQRASALQRTPWKLNYQLNVVPMRTIFPPGFSILPRQLSFRCFGVTPYSPDFRHLLQRHLVVSETGASNVDNAIQAMQPKVVLKSRKNFRRQLYIDIEIKCIRSQLKIKKIMQRSLQSEHRMV